MGRPPVDPRRTCPAVPATPDDLAPGSEEYTTPGLARALGGDHLLFACPGCGRPGAIRAGRPKPVDRPSWEIVSGAIAEVTTLTLAPSIHCVGCCGWHGYLTAGTFISC